MRKIYLFAAMAGMLASCSSDDLSKEKAAVQTAEPGAVLFEAYTQRGVTRAGQTGIMDTDKLKAAVDKTNQNGGGFGVFGYYTDNNDYEQSRMPDFMYNQLVEWDGYWKYEPIKYWPNEYGSNAISDDADKVTFFAYAPYVATNASGKIERTTGDDLTSYGITGLSRNSNQGDPIVKYIASFERDKSVDLLWGIVGAAEATGWGLTNGGTQNIDEGYPWLNVMRPAEAETQALATQRVKFTFAHALTQLTMNIDAIVDEINKGGNTLATGTKIYVRQLSMTGVALKGALNLNNTEAGKSKALWLDYNGLADIESGVPVVLYDGRKDGKEGVAGATASNEKILGFNSEIISDDGNNSEGVTETPKKVFADDPVMLIPTGENMELEIIYDVETTDEMLPTLLSDGKTPGSSIENKVRKTIDFPQNGIPYGLENGKHYTINLHLGMNSVKFDVAGIDGWVEVPSQPDVDLPSNGSTTVPGVANVVSAALSTFPAFTGLAYDETTYEFSVTGLDANESITKAVVSESLLDAIRNSNATATVKVSSTNDFSGAGDDKANAEGETWVQVTLGGNPYVHNLAATDNYILIEGKTSLKGWKARFEQAAHPFGLAVTSVANGTGDTDVITLNASDATVDADALTLGTLDATHKSAGAPTDKESDFVKISVNGYPLVYGTGYTYADKKITTTKHLVPGDRVAITVAAFDGTKEDGTKETVEFTVGGIWFAPTSQTLTYKASPATQNALVPQWIGKATPTFTFTETAASALFDIATDAVNNVGEITTLKSGTVVDGVKCEASFTAGDNYFYTVTSTTATYTLTINKQATTTAFTPVDNTITNQPIAAESAVNWTKTVTVTADVDGSLPTTSVEYTLESAVYDGTEDASALFDLTTAGVLTVKTGKTLEKSKTYKLTIKATYPETDGYATSSATKEITVTTVGI